MLLVAYFNYGMCLCKLQDENEAEKNFLRAFKLSMHSFGPNHFFTLKVQRKYQKV